MELEGGSPGQAGEWREGNRPCGEAAQIFCFPHHLGISGAVKVPRWAPGAGCYGCQLESELKVSRQGTRELVRLAYGCL